MNAHMAAQRSPEWHAARNGRITGSRVGAILGLNKYQTRDDVMRDMVRAHVGAKPEFTGNEATQWGQDHEPHALADYSFETGASVAETGLHVHPKHDWLAASPDGLVGEDGMVECKAPFRAKYTSAADKPEYMAQMQLQMAVTGRDWCDFIIWRKGKALIIERVQRDAMWLKRVMPDLKAFIEQFREIVSSDELRGPYLVSKERDDDEWRRYTQTLRNAKAAMDEAKTVYDATLAHLSDMAPSGASGCGVTLSRVERPGSISYSSAIKELAPDADLEPYRGKPSTYYKASIDS